MNPAEANKKQIMLFKKFGKAKRLKLALSLTEFVNKLNGEGKKSSGTRKTP